MRKTPTYVKCLAENYARAAGDVQRFKKIIEDIAQKLAEAEADLASCDRLIRKFDTRLDPQLIAPIHAWKGRYGKRGGLRSLLKRLIHEASPNAITTTELGWGIQIEFRLEFATWREKWLWQKNSLLRALKCLLAEGAIERLHDVSDGATGEVGRWRWKSDAGLSLDHLRALAEDSGVSVQPCDTSHA